MQIKYLMDDPDYLNQTTELLFDEWSHLSSWSEPRQILTRLTERNSPDKQQFTLVALDAENNVTAAGSLICYELKDNPNRMYWLGEVVTRPTHRGQGTGSALIKRIVELATERNIAELWLYTPDKQSLYRSLGWKECEQRMVDGESVTVMALSLPANARS
ncbi:GNAT family N-acetyltransferase [Pantoea stewartii]|uniref:GNAT family N-acetyltransferase n=1 Tax=Pantoea stewartii TaxID=66269 RepID=UPI003242AC72